LCFIGYSFIIELASIFISTQEYLSRVYLRSRRIQCCYTSVWSVDFFEMQKLSHHSKHVTLLSVRARLTVPRTTIEARLSAPCLQVVIFLSPIRHIKIINILLFFSQAHFSTLNLGIPPHDPSALSRLSSLSLCLKLSNTCIIKYEMPQSDLLQERRNLQFKTFISILNKFQMYSIQTRYVNFFEQFSQVFEKLLCYVKLLRNTFSICNYFYSFCSSISFFLLYVDTNIFIQLTDI